MDNKKTSVLYEKGRKFNFRGTTFVDERSSSGFSPVTEGTVLASQAARG
ncbi:hypothetical protein ACQKI4_15685 [Paenibacillus glucanolyticus]|jgi:hypothetical protein